MMMNFDVQTWYRIALTMMAIICAIVTFRHKPYNRVAGRFLVLYFWAFTYSLAVVYLLNYGYERTFPHLFGTLQIGSLPLLPLSYFYVQQTLYPRKLRYRDLWHLLPLLIFLVDYLPFFLLPAREKLIIIARMNTGNLKLAYDQGIFMPAYGHVAIRYAVGIAYFIAEIILIKNANVLPASSVLEKYPVLLKWIKMLAVSQFIFYLLPMAAAIFANLNMAKAMTIAAVLVSIVQCCYLMVYPNLLYGVVIFETVQPPGTGNPISQENEKLAGNPVIGETDGLGNLPNYTVHYSEELLNEIETCLKVLLENNKPFLNCHYGLQELSDDTGYSPHKLSAYINRRCGTNFNHYINKFRVLYFIDKIAAGEQNLKTLAALSSECGFRDRTTFYRAFRNVMQCTPTDYIKKIK